jgi:hypothetical protein
VLTGGYGLRPIDSYSNISDKPLTSSAVNGRLKSYLFKLNLWEGETPHSTRFTGQNSRLSHFKTTTTLGSRISTVFPVHKFKIIPSAVNGRLKSYLFKLNLWEGETPHSTRGGCALTLAWMGIDQESIKQHVGWKSNTKFHHYTAGNDMCKVKAQTPLVL